VFKLGRDAPPRVYWSSVLAWIDSACPCPPLVGPVHRESEARGEAPSPGVAALKPTCSGCPG